MSNFEYPLLSTEKPKKEVRTRQIAAAALLHELELVLRLLQYKARPWVAVTLEYRFISFISEANSARFTDNLMSK